MQGTLPRRKQPPVLEISMALYLATDKGREDSIVWKVGADGVSSLIKTNKEAMLSGNYGN